MPIDVLTIQSTNIKKVTSVNRDQKAPPCHLDQHCSHRGQNWPNKSKRKLCRSRSDGMAVPADLDKTGMWWDLNPGIRGLPDFCMLGLLTWISSSSVSVQIADNQSYDNKQDDNCQDQCNKPQVGSCLLYRRGWCCNSNTHTFISQLLRGNKVLLFIDSHKLLHTSIYGLNTLLYLKTSQRYTHFYLEITHTSIKKTSHWNV